MGVLAEFYCILFLSLPVTIITIITIIIITIIIRLLMQ